MSCQSTPAGGRKQNTPRCTRYSHQATHGEPQGSTAQIFHY
ncbi:unnamed protein product, partial [Staurois parvus]